VRACEGLALQLTGVSSRRFLATHKEELAAEEMKKRMEAKRQAATSSS
jgi:hypothetical protein